MDLKKVQQLLKSVWTTCHAHNTLLGSTECTKFATLQVVQVRKTTRNVKSKVLKGVVFTYTEDDYMVEGNYCAKCAPIRLKFAQESIDMEIWDTRQIPGFEEAINVMGEEIL